MPGMYKARRHQQSRRATRRRQPRLALSLRLRANGILPADARRFISVGIRFGASWGCVQDSRSSNACDARGLVSGRASSLPAKGGRGAHLERVFSNHASSLAAVLERMCREQRRDVRLHALPAVEVHPKRRQGLEMRVPRHCALRVERMRAHQQWRRNGHARGRHAARRKCREAVPVGRKVKRRNV